MTDAELKAHYEFLRSISNGTVVKMGNGPRHTQFIGRVGRVTDLRGGSAYFNVVFADGSVAGSVQKSEIAATTLAERKAFRAEKATKDETARERKVARDVAATIRSNAGRRF